MPGFRQTHKRRRASLKLPFSMVVLVGFLIKALMLCETWYIARERQAMVTSVRKKKLIEKSKGIIPKPDSEWGMRGAVAFAFGRMQTLNTLRPSLLFFN